MVVYFDHGPCEGGVPEKPQVSKRTEGHGEILRTELNFPQDHKHDPKFHVGPNLQRMGEFLCGHLPVVGGCSGSFLRFGCAGEFSSCVH